MLDKEKLIRLVGLSMLWSVVTMFVVRVVFLLSLLTGLVVFLIFFPPIVWLSLFVIAKPIYALIVAGLLTALIFWGKFKKGKYVDAHALKLAKRGFVVGLVYILWFAFVNAPYTTGSIILDPFFLGGGGQQASDALPTILGINIGQPGKEARLASRAFKSSNPDYCASIENPRRQEECLRGVERTASDVSVCNKAYPVVPICPTVRDPLEVGLRLINKESCYAKVAVNTNNIDVCREINDCPASDPNDESPKDACLSFILDEAGRDNSPLAKDVKVCDAMDGLHWRDLCYSQVGGRTYDLSLCGIVKDQGYKNQCYEFAAEGKNDPAICELILDDPGFKSMCLGNIKIHLDLFKSTL